MPPPEISVQPLDAGSTFRNQVYRRLKQAIIQMDIYDHPGDVRLDERQLSGLLGVSRTPIREALTLLEQEGLVRLEPRRGIFVVRKTKTEIIEMIIAWAALESMATRLPPNAPPRRTSAPCGTSSAASRSRRPPTICRNIPTPTSSSTRPSSG